MRLLSDAAEYALRSAVYLADKTGQPQTTQQIAAGTKAAPGYLARVLQDMGKAGILNARRGIGGGFTLAIEPADLTVLDVINAVDPIERIKSCPLSLKSHSIRLCPLHRRLDEAIAEIQRALSATTIADVLHEDEAARPLCEAAAEA